MSAINAIGCRMNLTKMFRKSGFMLGPIIQLLRQGQLSLCKESLTTTRNLCVAMSSLIKHDEQVLLDITDLNFYCVLSLWDILRYFLLKIVLHHIIVSLEQCHTIFEIFLQHLKSFLGNTQIVWEFWCVLFPQLLQFTSPSPFPRMHITGLTPKLFSHCQSTCMKLHSCLTWILVPALSSRKWFLWQTGTVIVFLRSTY